MIDHLIEFHECANSDGETVARLRCEELPKGRDAKDFGYHIRVRSDGWCECVSRANGAGSTRYYTFRTYTEAQVHAVKWASRKIAEARRNMKVAA